MCSSRSYRRGLSPHEAIRRLIDASGQQFDSVIVGVFIPIAEKEVLNVFAASGTASRAAL